MQGQRLGTAAEMKVVVTGASGNAGVALLDVLERCDEVTSVTGIARRPPGPAHPEVDWVQADVAVDDLRPALEGADALVHLAWLIQPSRDEGATWATNVGGTARLLAAAAEVGVSKVVVASSIGAYAPGPKDAPVDESWPTTGVGSSSYSREKAYVERLLDVYERDHPETAVVRVRPALVLQHQAGPEVRRYFAGPLVPGRLLNPRWLRVLPSLQGIRVQAVHASDLANAYVQTIVKPVRGPFNVAAEPPLDAAALAEMLGARLVPVSPALARRAAQLTWNLHLQPTEPGWLDLAAAAPVMSCERARTQLDWSPSWSAGDAFLEVIRGAADREGGPAPPLRADTTETRAEEIRTGLGGTDHS